MHISLDPKHNISAEALCQLRDHDPLKTSCWQFLPSIFLCLARTPRKCTCCNFLLVPQVPMPPPKNCDAAPPHCRTDKVTAFCLPCVDGKQEFMKPRIQTPRCADACAFGPPATRSTWSKNTGWTGRCGSHRFPGHSTAYRLFRALCSGGQVQGMAACLL